MLHPRQGSRAISKIMLKVIPSKSRMFKVNNKNLIWEQPSKAFPENKRFSKKKKKKRKIFK